MNPAEQLILAVDVGNTRIKCGLFELVPGRLPLCRHAAAGDREQGIPWQDLFACADFGPLHSTFAIIAGSHPEQIQQLVNNWPKDGPTTPHVVDSWSDIPLTVNLPEPGQVGIDRLLNAVAANRLRSDGDPVVIIDSGTATTVDVVSASGAFAGGAILPGLELSSRALEQYTARLPRVDVADMAKSTPPPLGRCTSAAIRSGLFWGQLGAVKELVSRLSADLNDPQILLTGGGSESLTPYLRKARYEPHLSLQGLALTRSRCQ